MPRRRPPPSAGPSASQIDAYRQAHLEELASRPNTTVYTVQHDRVSDPWPAARLRPLMESLVARALSFDDSVDDFRVRKTCLDDPEALAFYRTHPKMYLMMTDRQVMREERYRKAITGLLFVREEVERGGVADGPDADAMATRTVMAALTGSDLGAAPSAAPSASPAVTPAETADP